MSELDQTIEELEAEVLAELEEAEDPTKKGAAPAEKSKMKNDAEDTGKPVVDPEQKDAPAKKAVAKAKEVSSDPAQKGEGSPDKPETVKGTSDEKKLRPGAGKNAGPQKLAASHVPEEFVWDEGEELEEGKMTKAQAIEQISKMKKSEIEEMIANHSSKLAEAENAQSEEELAKLKAEKDAIEEKIASISVKEDVDALVDGEDLSEEFKEKAATVFEAAIKSKLRSEIDRIHKEVSSEK